MIVDVLTSFWSRVRGGCEAGAAEVIAWLGIRPRGLAPSLVVIPPMLLWF